MSSARVSSKAPASAMRRNMPCSSSRIRASMPAVDAGTVASVGGSGRPGSAPASGAMANARVRAAHRRLEIGVRVFMRNSFEAGEMQCIGIRSAPRGRDGARW